MIFDKNTKDYSITTKEEKLELSVELENNESTYEVIGNENLKDGSIIQIIVTDKDGNNNIYRLKINKIEEPPKQEETFTETQKEEKQEEKTNLIPPIMKGLLIILGIIFIILLAIKLINNKKKINKSANENANK